LGEMGEPVSYEHNGTLIKFCCKPCIPKFQKNPAKYLVILREELEAEKNGYKSDRLSSYKSRKLCHQFFLGGLRILFCKSSDKPL
jgi:hypothetical protein